MKGCFEFLWCPLSGRYRLLFVLMIVPVALACEAAPICRFVACPHGLAKLDCCLISLSPIVAENKEKAFTKHKELSTFAHASLASRNDGSLECFLSKLIALFSWPAAHLGRAAVKRTRQMKRRTKNEPKHCCA